jgi:hypothetical protein
LHTYGVDLVFLDNFVWPRARHDQMAHDAFNCWSHPNSFPFPTQRSQAFEQGGQGYESDLDRTTAGRKGRPHGTSATSMHTRPEDIKAMQVAEAPMACRRNDGWTHG